MHEKTLIFVNDLRCRTSAVRPAVRRAIGRLLLLLTSICLLPPSAQAQTPGAFVVGADSLVEYRDGAYLGLGCNHLEVFGTFLLDGGEAEMAHDVLINGIFDAGSGYISAGGNWITNGIFLPGTGTVVLNGLCRAGPVQIPEPTTFCRLELGEGIEYQLPDNGEIVVECELDLGDDNTLTPTGPDTSTIVLGPRARVVGRATLNRVRILHSGGNVEAIPTLGTFAALVLTVFMLGGAMRSRRFLQPIRRTRRNSG